tara:strand:- start:92552 stop:92749 length:198 start_codon:yes stop_codon:yes gene_type:complete
LLNTTKKIIIAIKNLDKTLEELRTQKGKIELPKELPLIKDITKYLPLPLGSMNVQLNRGYPYLKK